MEYTDCDDGAVIMDVPCVLFVESWAQFVDDGAGPAPLVTILGNTVGVTCALVVLRPAIIDINLFLFFSISAFRMKFKEYWFGC